MQTFQLPKLAERTGTFERLIKFLTLLPMECGWVIEVKRLQRKRSDAQNRYLWGVCYPAIMEHLKGWDANDVHEYCLGECFGWESLEGLGRKRLRPIRRSSKLSVTEFMDYVDWIQRDMATRGIFVPDPARG